MQKLILLLMVAAMLTGCGMTDAVNDAIDGTEKAVEDGADMVEDGVDNIQKGIDDAGNEAERMKDDMMNKPTSKLQNDAVSVAADYSSYNNDSFGFGFKKAEKGTVPDVGVYGGMMKDKNAAYFSKDSGKKIFLTFDEGYENGYTVQILDILKEKNCPAAFFVTGDYLKDNSELIQRMIDEKHIIGNHTWNHPSMPQVMDTAKFQDELTKLDDYLYEKHGIRTTYFRYPSGEFSERTLQIIKDMGYKTAFWSLAYKDWERDVVKGADYAFNEVVNHIHDGAIILLHAVSKDNADALGRIIDQLRSEGYEFCSLEEAVF